MIKWNKGYRVLGCCLLLAVLTGCGSKIATVQEVMDEIKTTGERKEGSLKLDFDDVILQVNSYNVTYREVLFYIYQAKSSYEKKLNEQIWDVVLESGDTLEEFAKQQLVKQITEIKIIGLKAAEDDVALTSEEKEKSKKEASAFLETLTEEEKEIYGMQEKTVESIYQENAIAAKIYDKIEGASEKKKGVFEKEYEKWSDDVEIKMSIGLWKKINIHSLGQ